MGSAQRAFPFSDGHGMACPGGLPSCEHSRPYCIRVYAESAFSLRSFGVEGSYSDQSHFTVVAFVEPAPNNGCFYVMLFDHFSLTFPFAH